jgi:hypothetical protein
MKSKILLIGLIFLLCLPGCLVKSLRPFYTDEDVVFFKSLTGKWIDQDSTLWEIEQWGNFSGLFKPDTPDSSYRITMTDNKGKGIFHAHLFCLKNKFFIDFFPKETDSDNELLGMHMVPSHSVARVLFQGDKIQIRWYNEEWLSDLFKQNRIRLSHVEIPYEASVNDETSQIILTASTTELQKFLLKYGDDPQAFSKGGDEDYNVVLDFTLSRLR